jgi:uncharacterized protein YkwD
MRRLFAVILAGMMMQTMVPAGVDVRGSDGLEGTTLVSARRRCWSPTRGERAFARRINSARAGADFGSVRLDPELSKSAKVHTREMARRSSLYHTPSSTLRRRVTNWSILGENVGYGGGVDSLHRAFMGSPAHRANILLGTYRYVGIGVLNRDGRMWVTVLFEGRSDPGTTLRMRRC